MITPDAVEAIKVILETQEIPNHPAHMFAFRYQKMISSDMFVQDRNDVIVSTIQMLVQAKHEAIDFLDKKIRAISALVD